MTGLLGRARLDALRVAVEVAELAPVGNEAVGGVEHMALVVVGLGDLRGLGVADLHEFLVGHQRARDEIDVPRGGVVVGIVQAGGVDVVRVFAAERGSALVHPLHELGDVPLAAHGLGENVARLVRRDDEHTLQKLLDRQHLADLDAGGAAVDAQSLEGALVRRDGLVERELPRVDRLEHQQRHRQLGDACGVVSSRGHSFRRGSRPFPSQRAGRRGRRRRSPQRRRPVRSAGRRAGRGPKKEQKSGVFSWKCTSQYVTIKFDRTIGGRLARARRYSTFSITKKREGVQPWNGRKKAEAHISFWRS